MKFQKLYFSKFTYGGLMPVFPDDNPYDVNLHELSVDDSALLITGIANPRGFVRHFKSYSFRKKVYHFSDHHDFSREDVARISEQYDHLSGRRRIILTTEKDAVRLAYNPYYPEKLRRLTYFVPVAVEMVEGVEYSDFIADLRKLIDD